MQFEETFDFDCDASAVMRVLTDSECYRTKYDRIDPRTPEFLGSQLSDGQFTISMRHELQTEELPLPDFISKRLGDHLDLYQTDTWKIDQRTGHIEIKLQSAPLEIGIDTRLVEREVGSSLILQFHVKADIAMFRRKLEHAVADAITRRMHKELEETARMATNRA